WLVALHAGSDALIFLSYSAIPVALVIALRRRPDVRFRGLVALFAAFIMLCGLTHLVSLVTLWIPVYPAEGALKLLTGLVSATTAVVLFSLIPTIVRIPSPSQLEAANAALRAEIDAHRATLDQLRAMHAELEERVAQRTEELSAANARLELTARESVHRAKNLLAVVTSIARQTARDATDIATFRDSLTGRINALATATASVVPRPGHSAASIGDLLARQLAPAIETYGDRVSLHGPEIELTPDAAQHLGLAAHELSVNAIKHGALSVPEGRVDIRWWVEQSETGPDLVFSWQEEGGGTPSERSGFGTRLLTQAVPMMLEGEAGRDFAPQGLRYHLRAPVASVSGRNGAGKDETEEAAMVASAYPA
ncbi:MAG: HWE histidine kinase domain-containing protein, partial [Gemmobacter sp.]